MEPSSHSCDNAQEKSEDLQCLSPLKQIPVSSTLQVSNESVLPSWLQRMKDEEEELEEAMTVALASGIAHYLDPSLDSSMDMETPQCPSVTSSISASSSSDPDAAFDPDSTVRIIKPLPKRDRNSRFPDAARLMKPLPKRPLRSRITKPLFLQMSKPCNFSDPESQPLVVEGSVISSSSKYVPPSPPASNHDMSGSENSTIPDAVRVIKPLPKRMSKGRSFNDPQSEPLVVEGSTTPLSPASPPSRLISDYAMGGSEDITIPDTVRIIKLLPKRMSKSRKFNDPGTHPPVAEVSTTFSAPTHISLSNPTPDYDIGGPGNKTLTTTTQSYSLSDQDTGLSNVVKIQTPAVAEGLTTPIAPPPVPSPIRPIDNGTEPFFVTTPPHNSKALADPSASTSMDNLNVPPTSSPAPLAKLSSSTSLPSVSFNKNRSRVKSLQTLANASDDDAELDALIRRFSKSRVVWVEDDPDPIPIPQPIVPLQASRVIDNNGVATDIPDRSAGNMIVDLTETTMDVESIIHKVKHSREVSQYVINMSCAPQHSDSSINKATLNTDNLNSNNNNSFSVDVLNSSPRHETNDVQSLDTITSTLEPNVSSNELSSFSESPESLSRPALIPNQLEGDASMGVGYHQPSWQQGFDNNCIPVVERYDSNLTCHVANSPSLTSINVDNQRSPVLAGSETDEYAMNWDENESGFPTSNVFPGKNGLLVAKQSMALSDATPTLFEQADPWDAVGHILSDTKSPKAVEEVEELDELAAEDTTAVPMSGNMSLAKSTSPTFSPNLELSGDNENIFMNNFNIHPHNESSAPQIRSLSLELDNNESELSATHDSIASDQLNTIYDLSISQTLVHPNDLGQTPATPSTNYPSEDSSDDESWEEVQLGDDVESHSLVAAGFTSRFFASTEESDSNYGFAGITVNDPPPSNVQLQSTSMSLFELSQSILGHYLIPSPKDQEQQPTSTSEPIPFEPAPANEIDSLNKRGQTTVNFSPIHSDPVSVDESSSSSEPAQSVSATFSVPVIAITRSKDRTQSPPNHTSPAFLSAFFRPRSPASPSILQPAELDNSNMPAPADIVRAPCIEVSPAVQTEVLDTVTPAPAAVSQLITSDRVTFNTRNSSFVPPALLTEVYAPFSYEPPDVDMYLDTSLDPPHLPHYHPIADNTSTNVPELWSWGDTQQGSNEDDDRMDLLRDKQMTFSSRSNLCGQSYQVYQIDSEMAFAGDWCYADGDVEMGHTMPPELEVPHPMDVDPWFSNVANTLEASVDALPPITQSHSLALPPRTTVLQDTPGSMMIPPLHPDLLTGDMSAFIKEISTMVKNLDSFTSLELEAQTVPVIQSPANQLASASNSQPMAHERVLQTPDSEAPVHELSTAELSSDKPNKDGFSSLNGNPVVKETAQSEDTDSNVHPNRLPDYGAESNILGMSNSKWDLRSYERWSLVNDACWTKFPCNGGEMPIRDRDGIPFENSFSSKIKSNPNLTKSFTGISPSRPGLRVRFAVDIVNTRFTFGTETSGLQSQSSAQSTALRIEVSSHMKSIPESSISSTPELGKAVETLSLWGMLWGALTSLFYERSPRISRILAKHVQ